MFEDTGHGNFVAQGDGFHVSYNPSVADGPYGAEAAVMGAIASLISGEQMTNGEETALCDNATGAFHILSGDFREAYATEIPKGYAACLAVYEKFKEEYHNPWSFT